MQAPTPPSSRAAAGQGAAEVTEQGRTRAIALADGEVRALAAAGVLTVRRSVEFAPPAHYPQPWRACTRLLSFDGRAARFRDSIGLFVPIVCPFGRVGDVVIAGGIPATITAVSVEQDAAKHWHWAYTVARNSSERE